MERTDDSHVPIPVGSLVDGRYRIGELLGRGGMGSVYRAEHLRMRREVALKILDTPHDARRRVVERFEREARATARLHHPRCVRTFDFGSHGQLLYLAMERLEGPTLAEALAARRPSIADAVRITGQILDALAHAHERGVLHRDVKPENVILYRRRSEPGVVLIDFGLARMVGEPPLTALGICAGSPSYLSPERVQGRPYDETADVYSAGVVLYELLTGVRPFCGASPLEIARGHIEQRPRDPREHDPRIPAPLARIVLRSLAKRPDDRFPTAAAMRATLACLPPLPVHAMAPAARVPASASTTYLDLELRPERSFLTRLRSWWTARSEAEAMSLPTVETAIVALTGRR